MRVKVSKYQTLRENQRNQSFTSYERTYSKILMPTARILALGLRHAQPIPPRPRRRRSVRVVEATPFEAQNGPLQVNSSSSETHEDCGGSS